MHIKLAEVPDPVFIRSLKNGQFRLRVGEITIRLETHIEALCAGIRQLYSHYPVSVSGGYYDFDLGVHSPSLLRRWFRPNVVFSLSGQTPFLPMAAANAHALFEWGFNWTIGSSIHHYLVLHSAVVEKNGKGVLLAAASGSGKSTLTAELVLNGWRLFSDELGLVSGKITDESSSLCLMPFPRPVSLKNQSIDLIKQRHPEAVFGASAFDTQKGTVAHMRVPNESVARASEPAPPKLIIFPKWVAGVSLRVQAIGAGDAAMRLINQSFNYSVLGSEGFNRLADLVSVAPAWELEYSSFEDALQALDDLLADVD